MLLGYMFTFLPKKKHISDMMTSYIFFNATFQISHIMCIFKLSVGVF